MGLSLRFSNYIPLNTRIKPESWVKPVSLRRKSLMRLRFQAFALQSAVLRCQATNPYSKDQSNSATGAKLRL